jgi:hypothetical protein
MPLSTYEIPMASIPLGKNNSFDVRAITFPDLTFMVEKHLPALTAILAKYKEAQEEVYSRRSIADFAVMIARDFPSFAVEIISVCISGEDETADREALSKKVALLGAPVQINAMLEIARLTVDEAGGLKNLTAGLRTKLQAAMANAALTPTEAPNS